MEIHGQGVDGKVRFGSAGVWFGATFTLEADTLAVHRNVTGDVHYIDFMQIVNVDEIAAAHDTTFQTVEFTLADSSTVAAQIPAEFVAALVTQLTAAPAVESSGPPQPEGPPYAPPASPPPYGGADPVDRVGPEPAASGARSKVKPLLVAGVLLVAVAATGMGGWWFISGRNSTPTMPGPDAVGISFTLLDLDGDIYGTYGSCSGSGGYSDFGAGMDIVVTDQDNKIIGSGSTSDLETLKELEPEYFEADYEDDDFDESAEVLCQVGALVPLSAKADFYQVKVGRRGDTSYSYDEMVEQDWELSLSLG
ncbi:MAG: hypothetical protein WBF71_02800 [Microthrixaceae bacterium]